MKKVIGFIIIFLPIVCYSQFNINYSPTTNTMSVEYTGCDICVLGSNQAVNICNCRLECQEDLTEEQGYYELCKDYWEYESQSGGTYNSLFEECGEDPTLSCQQNCGTLAKPLKNVTQYLYRLKVAWAEIPFDPINSNNIIYKSEIWTHHWESNYPQSVFMWPWDGVSSPWPEIYSNHNTCYGVEVIIFYDDGTSCAFNIWDCNIIG